MYLLRWRRGRNWFEEHVEGERVIAHDGTQARHGQTKADIEHAKTCTKHQRDVCILRMIIGSDACKPISTNEQGATHLLTVKGNLHCVRDIRLPDDHPAKNPLLHEQPGLLPITRRKVNILFGDGKRAVDGITDSSCTHLQL